VHGANRLASNSLLEGVVFGIRAGRAMREAAAATPVLAEEQRLTTETHSLAAVQRIAWEKCGILRSAEGLQDGIAQLSAICPQGPEEHNIRQVALLIARCALAREESRGAQFRTDFPTKSDAFALHSVISREGEVTFR
jgi:L-aspartate oxidase